jgi:hypothetical protein
MPAIADQVAELEHDHIAALADIDALWAANAALTDALDAVTAEKAALEAKVAELSGHNDGLIAMAESVADSALNMLKAARLPKDTPAAVIPYAPRTTVERLQAAGIVNGHATDESTMSPGLGDIVNRVSQVLIDDDVLKPEPARQAAPEPFTGSDETHIRLVVAAGTPLVPASRGFLERMAPPLAEFPTSAVERIKRHFMPTVTLMCQPPDTERADPGGLPMFLRRDTVFARAMEAA